MGLGGGGSGTTPDDTRPSGTAAGGVRPDDTAPPALESEETSTSSHSPAAYGGGGRGRVRRTGKSSKPWEKSDGGEARGGFLAARPRRSRNA